MELQADFLKSNYENNINDPLVMAKTAYALTLYDYEDEDTIAATRKLSAMKRVTVEGRGFSSQFVTVSSQTVAPTNFISVCVCVCVCPAFTVISRLYMGRILIKLGENVET